MSLKELVQLQKSLVSTEKTWRLHLILPHESKTPSLSRLWSHEDQAEYWRTFFSPLCLEYLWILHDAEQTRMATPETPAEYSTVNGNGN
jgi:hypothetical protein